MRLNSTSLTSAGSKVDLKGVEFPGWTFSDIDPGSYAREDFRRHRSIDDSGDRSTHSVGFHDLYVHGRDAWDIQSDRADSGSRCGG